MNLDFTSSHVQLTLSNLRLSLFGHKKREKLLAARPKRSDIKYIPPIDTNNERRTLTKLRRMCNEKLQEYPRTLQEDLDLYEKEDLTLNQKNSLQVTIEEK